MSNHRLPYFQHYVKDSASDPRLAALSLSAFGAFWKVIEAIHMDGTGGAIEYPVKLLARYLRATEHETLQAIAEFVESGALDVYADKNVLACDGRVTLLCRRIAREADARKSHADKMKKRRGGEVTDECRPSDAAVRHKSQIQSQSQIQMQSQTHTETTTELPPSPPAQVEVLAKPKKPAKTPDDWTPKERLAHSLKSAIKCRYLNPCIGEIEKLLGMNWSVEKIQAAIAEHAKPPMSPFEFAKKASGYTTTVARPQPNLATIPASAPLPAGTVIPKTREEMEAAEAVAKKRREEEDARTRERMKGLGSLADKLAGKWGTEVAS